MLVEEQAHLAAEQACSALKVKMVIPFFRARSGPLTMFPDQLHDPLGTTLRPGCTDNPVSPH